MSIQPPEVLQRFSAHVQGRVDSWRTGSRGSQVYVLFLLLGLVAITFVVSWYALGIVPLTAWFLWLLVGMLVLRFVPLTVLCGTVVLASVLASLHEGLFQTRVVAGLIIEVLAVAVILFHASRQKSGLPVALSEPMLARLRDRLQAQGRMPALPAQWRAQSALLTAHGTSYAGDFLVTDVQDDRWLEVVLVDVCGKGVTVGAQALQFSGALGGLIGALPPAELMQAANTFLLRQDSEESFATAVHLLVDMDTGDYMINSAGHPPALRWDSEPGGWFIDSARGTALGVIPDPDLQPSTGTLHPGEALMFYTDGVVEARGRDLDEGTEWLRRAALTAVLSRGFSGLPRRLLKQVPSGVDDRALLVIERLPGQSS